MICVASLQLLQLARLKVEVDRRSELSLFGSQSRRPPGVGVQAFPEEALFTVTQRGEPDADSSSPTRYSRLLCRLKSHRLPLRVHRS